jgi:glycosyltransferase domain-containing protein
MEFTIVCLSYNRPDALKQLISYYSSSTIHLIIADGSTTPLEPSKLLDSKNSNFTCSYLHIPSISAQPRLTAAVKLISTKYCCLIDDSDLILVTGIAKIIHFLDNNPDYSCVSGDAIYAYHDKIFKRTNFIPCGYWSSPLKLVGNSSDRLIKMITQGRSANVFYSITRTEHLIKFPELISNIQYDFSGSYELLWTAFLCLAGKYEKLDFPYLIRTGGDSYPEPIKVTNEYKNFKIPDNSIKESVEKLASYFPDHNKDPIYAFYEIHSKRLNLKYKKELDTSFFLEASSKFIHIIKISKFGSLLRLIKRYMLHLTFKSERWSNSLTKYYLDKNLSSKQIKDLDRANVIFNLYRKN